MPADFIDNCIILSVADRGDDDRLCKTLTAGHGLISVLFKGVKKSAAKLKPFAQPFAVFDARLLKNKGVFYTVIEPTLIQDGFSVCADLRMFTAASVAAEATAGAIGDEEPHPDMFVGFLKFIKALQFDGDAYYSACVYIVELLKLSGFDREYTYADEPKSPVQMLGYCQKRGYEKREECDMTRRALKFICGEYSRNFDIGLKSAASIDLY